MGWSNCQIGEKMEFTFKYLENLIATNQYNKALAHIEEIMSDSEIYLFPNERKKLTELANQCK